MTTATFEPLAVTGVGACTSVGLSAEQCSASVWAGINRFAEHPTYVAIGKSEANEDDVGPPAVAMVPTLDPELSLPERLMHLLTAAFDDLVENEPLEREMVGTSGFFLALPPEDAGTESLDLDEAFLEEFSERTGSTPFAMTKVSRAGNTGMAELVGEANRHLTAGELERCIVAGVDSYLLGDRLKTLDEAWRLKSPRNLGGFIPGEGATAIMIEAVPGAEARGAAMPLRIEGLGIHAEPNPVLGEKASSGQGLSEAIRDAVAPKGEGFACDWVIGDLNGEAYKAFEWGTVSVRLHSLFSNLSTLWHPADCVGDLGAATPGLHMMQAYAAFRRGYAPSGDVLMWSSSDNGQRAALLLSGDMNGKR
jgi:3-oxoacyl-[acyl-carrier-protein] synthase-1